MDSLSPPLLEGTTALYSFDITNEDDVAVPADQINTLTITYYDEDTGEIINGRDNQDALNVNDVTLETVTGATTTTTVSWLLQPEDTVVLHPGQTWETHVVQFRWSWAGQERFGAHQVAIGIQHMLHMPV